MVIIIKSKDREKVKKKEKRKKGNPSTVSEGFYIGKPLWENSIEVPQKPKEIQL